MYVSNNVDHTGAKGAVVLMVVFPLLIFLSVLFTLLGMSALFLILLSLVLVSPGIVLLFFLGAYYGFFKQKEAAP